MTRVHTIYRPIYKPFVCIALIATLFGCRDLSGTQPLPAGTVNPASVYNVAGGLGMAVSARALFQKALGLYIPAAGVLTDELQSPQRGANSSLLPSTAVDARLLDQASDWGGGTSPTTDGVYAPLQQVRGMAGLAIGVLRTYAPDSLLDTRAEMYALTGYAEIMLADLFCSGVPLSTLTFQGDYAYQPGSTTQQVYQHAIAQFDTAIALAADTSAIHYLAQVGEGRAELALGNYAAAGAAVASVPATFQYVDSLTNCSEGQVNSKFTGWTVQTCPDAEYVNQVISQIFMLLPSTGTVADREGGLGLPFISSGDPRTAVTQLTTNAPFGYYLYGPKKYPITGLSAIVVASGLEAQLIAAEAAINAGNPSGAFTTLNALRSANSITAGKLPALTDPGTFGAEIDTLFMERAAWLFVDGHRQGDLRRLVRQYENTQHVAILANGYPSGNYPNSAAVSLYGSFIDAPIPSTELNNHLFTGCLSRD